MSEDQMVWASRHDWYLGHIRTFNSEESYPKYRVVVRVGKHSRKTISTFQNLLIWAGYQ